MFIICHFRMNMAEHIFGFDLFTLITLINIAKVYVPIVLLLIKFVQIGDKQLVIFDRGCLRSGEEWVERNLVPVAGVAVALAVLQVWSS